MRRLWMLGAAVAMAACADSEEIGPDPARVTMGTGGHGAEGGAPAGGAGGEGGGAQIGVPWESGTRLKVRYIESTDGARQPVGWFDTERNEPCAFDRAADGSLRCLPIGSHANISTAPLFADPTCTSRAASLNCSAEGYAVEVTSCGSQAERRFYELGNQTTTVYTDSSGDCLPTTSLPGYEHYAFGAEVPASAFALAEEKHEP